MLAVLEKKGLQSDSTVVNNKREGSESSSTTSYAPNQTPADLQHPRARKHLIQHSTSNRTLTSIISLRLLQRNPTTNIAQQRTPIPRIRRLRARSRARQRRRRRRTTRRYRRRKRSGTRWQRRRRRRCARRQWRWRWSFSRSTRDGRSCWNRRWRRASRRGHGRTPRRRTAVFETRKWTRRSHGAEEDGRELLCAAAGAVVLFFGLLGGRLDGGPFVVFGSGAGPWCTRCLCDVFLRQAMEWVR